MRYVLRVSKCLLLYSMIRACPCGPGFRSKSSLESIFLDYFMISVSLWAFRSIPHANFYYYWCQVNAGASISLSLSLLAQDFILCLFIAAPLRAYA
jgi:hypothetical protein